MNKKISEMVKRGKTIFKSKIKWILALVLLTGCIYGSYTLSRRYAGKSEDDQRDKTCSYSEYPSEQL